ncbi:CLD4 protein, partial [Amia calva]|nr:CLD4 protein [Amia calva]
MGQLARQVVGLVLSIVGFLGVIIVCAIPMWRVTSYIGANIVTAQIIWDGLWMNCVMQSTGQMQCKIYDSLLVLPQDIQAARALIVIAIVVGAVGVGLAIMGGKCTSCMQDESTMAKVVILGGVFCIVAGVLCLIPVCWTASNIVLDFNNPLLITTQKRDIGAALYIGWASSGLLLLGGAILCTSCPPKEDVYRYAAKYSQYSYPGTVVPMGQYYR